MSRVDSVTDATKSLAVVVADRDRDGAVPCSPTKCPLANRLMRLRGVDDAVVGNGSMRLHRADGWHRYDLDVNTRAAREAYDDAGQLIPVGFQAVFVVPKKALGSRKGEKSGTDKRSGKGSVANRRPSSRSMWVEPRTAS